MAWSQPQPGVFELQFATDEDIYPRLHPGLIAAMHEAAKTHPLTVCIEVELVKADPSAANDWLEVATALGSQLVAVAVVSRATFIRALVGGFAMAARLHKQALQVEVFDGVDDARAWLERLR